MKASSGNVLNIIKVAFWWARQLVVVGWKKAGKMEK